MKPGRNWRKPLRNLSKDEIQERFDNHRKLHEFEVDYLFDCKNLSKEQYRWLMKGYRYFTIFVYTTQPIHGIVYIYIYIHIHLYML